jgi:hypothetical protein
VAFLKNAARKVKGADAPLEPYPEVYLPLDFDGVDCPGHIDPVHDVDEIADHLLGMLPSEFHEVSHVLQLTSSAGIETAPGQSRKIFKRLWFVADHGVTLEMAEAWLAGVARLDLAPFRGVQLTYLAAPEFVDMADPVPAQHRFVLRRGLSDTVILPDGLEARAVEHKRRHAIELHGGGPSATGLGYEGYKALIGDHDGGGGFHNPLLSAAGAYFARNASGADARKLLDDLTAAIRAADSRNHSPAAIQDRINALPDLIAWVRERQLEEDSVRAKVAHDRAAEAAEMAAEVCEPSWPLPTATAAEAAAANDAAIAGFMQKVYEVDYDAVQPPQLGVGGELGGGKTESYVRHSLELIAKNPEARLHIFLPAHVQTADVERRFADEAESFNEAAEAEANEAAAIFDSRAGHKIAHVWRGFDQPNPANPTEKMCPITESGKEVLKAIGHRKHICQRPAIEGEEAHYTDPQTGIKYVRCERHPGRAGDDMCGTQRLYLAAADPQNRVWIFPHAMLQRKIPEEQFGSLKPSAVIIDEAPWNAHIQHCGHVPYKLRDDALGKVYQVPARPKKRRHKKSAIAAAEEQNSRPTIDEDASGFLNSARLLAQMAVEGKPDGYVRVSDFLSAYKELGVAEAARRAKFEAGRAAELAAEANAAVAEALQGIGYDEAAIKTVSRASEAAKKAARAAAEIAERIAAGAGNLSDAVLNRFIGSIFRRASALAHRMWLDPMLSIIPGFDHATAKAKMKRFQEHNPSVEKLARFFKLAAKSMTVDGDLSPYLCRKTEEVSTDNGPIQVQRIHMYWSEDIASSWTEAPVLYLDGTMQPERARRYLPRLEVVSDVRAMTPEGVYRRQVYDRAVSHQMIAPDQNASPKNQQTQRNNALAAARVLEVKAAQFAGRGAYVKAAGKRIDALAVMPLATEEFMWANAALQSAMAHGHHNALRGVNLYPGVAYLALISRPSAPAHVVERMAWAEAGRVGLSIEPVVNGRWIETKYPKRKCGRLMRDETGRVAWQEFHPDPWAEMVRWSITEAEVLQCEARARAIWRTEDRPLLVDIVTNVPLRLPIDELITWDAWRAEGAPLATLRARGTDIGAGKGIPLIMTRLLPDVFKTQQAVWDHQRTPADASGCSNIKGTKKLLDWDSPMRDSSIRDFQFESIFVPFFLPTQISEAYRQRFTTISVRLEGGRYASDIGRNLAIHWPPKESLEAELGAPLDRCQLVAVPYQETLDAVDNLFVGDTSPSAPLTPLTWPTPEQGAAFVVATLALDAVDRAIAALPKAPGFLPPTYTWWQPACRFFASPIEQVVTQGPFTTNHKGLVALHGDKWSSPEAAKKALQRSTAEQLTRPPHHVVGEYRIVRGKAGPWSVFRIDADNRAQRRVDIKFADEAGVSVEEVELRGTAGDIVLRQRAIDEKDAKK